jgi:tetratricopeptide (TPR) repeat protein
LREGGTDRLEGAVVAYRAALEEWTRDRVPLDWAMTQMNLGNALATLGEEEPGTGRLEEAVAAYHAALEEWTRDRVPLDWAIAHYNLALTLETLAERNGEPDIMSNAAASFIHAAGLFEAVGHPVAQRARSGAQRALAAAARSDDG